MNIMISCREATRLTSQALEESLPAIQRLKLFLHLRLCQLCRRYQGQIRFLDRALRQGLEAVDPSKRLSGQARQKILDRAGEAVAETAAGSAEERP